MRARRLRSFAVVVALFATALPLVLSSPPATAIPNPVATDALSYTAFGRVWPDPQGCLNEVGAALPKGVSPWAKGNVCAVQFLQYEEVINGARFLEGHLRAAGFPYLQVINLQEAFDNPNYRSAGIPRTIAFEDGLARLMSRDRRPLYLFKVTDPTSPVPESEKQHFAYSLSIHGIERAGLEGGIRALEDLVTWAACEENASVSPVCAAEGINPGNPQPIVETPVPEGTEVPTAGEVLDNAVIWFYDPNPDGWARGQVAPAEFENGAPNASYAPNFFFQRYNGNGVDVNRDWPTMGYTFRPYSPASEPETKAYGEVLSRIRQENLNGAPFAGGLDLHGMITAYAFSYTLLGAGQRDFRKNALSVETSIRTWQDQTQRLAWSPWVSDPDADGENDAEAGCVGRGMSFGSPVFEGGTRGRVPACVADQWGTVIDTIGYQVTGGMSDWMDSPIGLDAIGMANEMYASHLAPNTAYEPALEQTHIDGNKGLIFSQIAALLTADEPSLQPGGRVGYVFDPTRLQVAAQQRPPAPELPAQNDIEVLLPCQSVAQQQIDPGCKGGTFTPVGTGGGAYEFQVRGPQEGVWNGGLTATYRGPNANGIGASNTSALQIQHFDEGQWHTVAYHFRQGGGGTNPNSATIDLYLPTGEIATVNDPEAGRWRVYFPHPYAFPGRLTIDFTRAPAEPGDPQAEVDASSMDFFPEQNQYVQGEEMQPVQVADIVANASALAPYDSVILVNNMGSPQYLRTQLGLTQKQRDQYFLNLKRWVLDGGNLVVTDAALQAVPEINKNLPASAVRTDDPYARSTATATTPSRAPAGSYYFNIGNTITYENPDQYPLARDVDKPGAAELERGRRQAAEPVPLGYTPDPGYDITPAMPVWGIDRAAWEATCRTPNCVTALSNPMDVDPGPAVNRQQHVSIGEMRFGAGTIRTAGVMFPDPVYRPDNMNDHRYGLADYALTYTAYEVFENLVDPTP